MCFYFMVLTLYIVLIVLAFYSVLICLLCAALCLRNKVYIISSLHYKFYNYLYIYWRPYLLFPLYGGYTFVGACWPCVAHAVSHKHVTIIKCSTH